MAILQRILNKVSTTAQGVYDTTGRAVVLSLAKAWIGIGMVHPATTENEPLLKMSDFLTRKAPPSSTRSVNRFDYKGLWSLQLDKYFMPLSQTFTVRAKKQLNVSHLIDGIDIIQQTRKEAKTIDCTLRITVRPDQPNLSIVADDVSNKMTELATLLRELYETDKVFAINNDMINNTFNVTHVMMSEFKFTPRAGMLTYTIDFTLTEVKFGDNVLTFDLREINSTDTTQREIV